MFLIENKYSRLIGATTSVEQWSPKQRKRVQKPFCKVQIKLNLIFLFKSLLSEKVT